MPTGTQLQCYVYACPEEQREAARAALAGDVGNTYTLDHVDYDVPAPAELALGEMYTDQGAVEGCSVILAASAGPGVAT